MAPGQYTELFFLDEATALAAGHRPCGTCQKSRYDSFKGVWIMANRDFIDESVTSIGDIDEHLHKERYASKVGLGMQRPSLSQLPDGCFVVRDSGPDIAWLYWKGEIYRWGPEGYHSKELVQPNEVVSVLTPSSIVRTLQKGFWPMVNLGTNRNYAAENLLYGKSTREPLQKKAESTESCPVISTPDSRKSSLEPQVARLHKPTVTPSGKELFTYFAAILRVTGMDQGKTYPLKQFLGNFSGHTNAGRIERHADGYRLTRTGLDYFQDRYHAGNPQGVIESEVKACMNRIMNGGKGWDAIGR